MEINKDLSSKKYKAKENGNKYDEYSDDDLIKAYKKATQKINEIEDDEEKKNDSIEKKSNIENLQLFSKLKKLQFDIKNEITKRYRKIKDEKEKANRISEEKKQIEEASKQKKTKKEGEKIESAYMSESKNKNKKKKTKFTSEEWLDEKNALKKEIADIKEEFSDSRKIKEMSIEDFKALCQQLEECKINLKKAEKEYERKKKIEQDEKYKVQQDEIDQDEIDYMLNQTSTSNKLPKKEENKPKIEEKEDEKLPVKTDNKNLFKKIGSVILATAMSVVTAFGWISGFKNKDKEKEEKLHNKEISDVMGPQEYDSSKNENKTEYKFEIPGFYKDHLENKDKETIEISVDTEKDNTFKDNLTVTEEQLQQKQEENKKAEIKNMLENIKLGDEFTLGKGIEYTEDSLGGGDRGEIGVTPWRQAGQYKIDGVAIVSTDKNIVTFDRGNMGKSVKELVGSKGENERYVFHIVYEGNDTGWVEEEDIVNVLTNQKENKTVEDIEK